MIVVMYITCMQFFQSYLNRYYFTVTLIACMQIVKIITSFNVFFGFCFFPLYKFGIFDNLRKMLY